MNALDILNVYISFFEKRGHRRIENSSLVPKDDPTTLFTSSGMQPLIKYILGEPYPLGKRLVNVQNCFRAQDIDEVGDNRHTTFFRMLGNWSLGDYFKSEQIPWFWEFLVSELKLDPKRLYVSVFGGYKNIPRDEESAAIWKELFKKENIEPDGRIFYLGVKDNWWSRSGTPDEMPDGEPGGPDSEVYFDLKPNDEKIVPDDLRKYTQSRRLLEIGNSVFMTYKKVNGNFEELPQKNVDFGGGLERLLAAVEDREDIFQTSLFSPIIKSIEKASNKFYSNFQREMRIITDHLVGASFMISEDIQPSNKEQGSVLRRLIRRSLDTIFEIKSDQVYPIIETIVSQYQDTDPKLKEGFEKINFTIIAEIDAYERALREATMYIKKEEKIGDELKGTTIISSRTAFNSLASYGIGPIKLKSMGYTFDEQKLAELIKQHKQKSRGQ